MKKLTPEEIKINTRWSERYYEELVKKLKEYEQDNSQQKRLQHKECKTCFYLRNNYLAGQAFTDYICRNCEQERSHHNTAVPKYCGKCSDEHNACVRCGAKIQ